MFSVSQEVKPGCLLARLLFLNGQTQQLLLQHSQDLAKNEHILEYGAASVVKFLVHENGNKVEHSALIRAAFYLNHFPKFFQDSFIFVQILGFAIEGW